MADTKYVKAMKSRLLILANKLDEERKAVSEERKEFRSDVRYFFETVRRSSDDMKMLLELLGYARGEMQVLRQEVASLRRALVDGRDPAPLWDKTPSPYVTGLLGKRSKK